DFTTQPSWDGASWACVVLTLGLCAATLAGGGTGSLDVPRPLLAFDISPTHPGVADWQHPTAGVTVRLNTHDSQVDPDLKLLSWNVVEDVFAAIANAADAFDGTIRDAIFSAINDHLAQLNLDFLFAWPTALHSPVDLPVFYTDSNFAPGHGA